MRKLADQRGTAAVEFSIVSVVLLIFLFGIITFGFIFALDNSLTHAAAEGARAAISKVEPHEQLAHARETTLGRLPGWIRNHMDPDGDGEVDAPAVIDAVIDSCVGAPDMNCLRVSISYPWAERPIIRPMPGFGIIAPDTITAEAEVQLD